MPALRANRGGDVVTRVWCLRCFRDSTAAEAARRRGEAELAPAELVRYGGCGALHYDLIVLEANNRRHELEARTRSSAILNTPAGQRLLAKFVRRPRPFVVVEPDPPAGGMA